MQVAPGPLACFGAEPGANGFRSGLAGGRLTTLGRDHVHGLASAPGDNRPKLLIPGSGPTYSVADNQPSCESRGNAPERSCFGAFGIRIRHQPQ